MNISTYCDEKKVDQDSDHDNVIDDSYRIERLERLVEILCTDLLHMKEQQMKSHKQVLELQSDLAAAEAARQAAEEQMEQQQRRHHELLMSIQAKQEQQQKDQHTSYHSQNDTKIRQQFDVIDVTTYCDGSDVNDYSDEHIIALEGVDQENAPQQYIVQLWEELSETVQRLSTDMIEQRDMLDFRWTKLQLEQNIRVHHIEEECVKQCEALKDMSIEWDNKLNELNEQIQQLRLEMTTEKSSTDKTNLEFSDKIQQITTQYTQIEQLVQRYIDYNRQIKGERIVMKRENEIQIQKLYNEIQNITNTIQQQSEHITNLQASGQHERKVDVTPITKTPVPVNVLDQKKITPNHDDNTDESKSKLHTRSISLSLPDFSSYNNENPMDQLIRERSHSI